MSTPAASSSRAAKVTTDTKLARLFGLKGETWMRHANPISVWSREWIGWWSLVPIALSLVFMMVNPLLFPPPRSTRNWASKGVFGERIWTDRDRVPIPDRFAASKVPSVTYGVQVVGVALLTWGLVDLDVLTTIAGLLIVQTSKAWFIDRMVLLYEDAAERDTTYAAWTF